MCVLVETINTGNINSKIEPFMENICLSLPVAIFRCDELKS